MSFLQDVIDLGPVTPANAPNRSSDPALDFYCNRLMPDQWHGRHRFAGGELAFPDAKKSRRLLREAQAARLSRNVAASLLEQALRLDYPGALDRNGPLSLRAETRLALGRPEASRALELYTIGCRLADLRRLNAAAWVYYCAARFDPAFVWPLNNLAWLLATSEEEAPRRGERAADFAEAACFISGWGCWSFLGTLAAGFARLGDFRRAVAWQKISLQLTPAGHRFYAQNILWEFEAGRPWTQRDRKVVAGHQISPEGLARIDADALVTRAQELIRAPRPTIH